MFATRGSEFFRRITCCIFFKHLVKFKMADTFFCTSDVIRFSCISCLKKDFFSRRLYRSSRTFGVDQKSYSVWFSFYSVRKPFLFSSFFFRIFHAFIFAGPFVLLILVSQNFHLITHDGLYDQKCFLEISFYLLILNQEKI